MFTIQRPIIGILANVLVEKEGSFAGRENIYVNRDYVTSLLQSEAIPILLPLVQDEEAIRAQMELVDGIILSGGYDVHPLYYGEEPHVKLEDVYPERDVYEIATIRIAAELKKPIFGICRGLQVMNVAFGGSLYQDMSLHSPLTEIQHAQQGAKHLAFHSIDIEPQSKLHHIFGKTRIAVNTFHHQAIKRLAPGFKVTARSIDSVIEGIEHEEAEFLIGVQWHPERMTQHDPLMRKLFRAFIEAASHYRGTRGRQE